MAVSFLFPVISAEAAERKWYEDNRLIAHALGSIDNKVETNSREAFLNSWSNGFRVVEADFTMTSDGNLVVRHDFDQDSYFRLEQRVQNGNTGMTLDRYVNEKINHRYTSLTAAQLIQLMNEYDDMYLITDTKYTDQASIVKQFTALVNSAKNLEREDVLDRVVVQIYNNEMQNVVKQIYPFKQWIYTLYQLPNPDYDKIGDFCQSNGIDVVTVAYQAVKPENVKKLADRGVKVYAHTVNRVLDLKRLLDSGCYGVYTDDITPYDLGLVGLAQDKIIPLPVKVQDKKVVVNAFSIKGSNHIKLRDFATLLAGTEKKFEVKYDAKTNTVQLLSGGIYTAVGNEMLLDKSGKGITKKSPYGVKLDDKDLDIQGYTVDGDLYFKPEDLASVMGIQWEKDSETDVFQLLLKQEKVSEEKASEEKASE